MDIKVNKTTGIESINQGSNAKNIEASKTDYSISWNSSIDSAEMENALGNMSLAGLQNSIKKTPTSYDIIKYYQQGHNAQETYNHFKETLSDLAKNDKAGFQSLVSSMLSLEGSKYDYSVPYKPIEGNQAEILEKFLTAQDHVDNAICTTIHGFMMDTLKELGINAALALGHEKSGHATLIYQLEDGKYVFNDYGRSLEVEADNVIEALQIVNKNTNFQSRGGYTEILGQGSDFYEQYSLEREAAYGDEIDSKTSNKDTSFTNSEIKGKTNLNAEYTGTQNKDNKIDVKGEYINEDSQFKASLGFQLKQTPTTNSFLSSLSYGVKGEIAKNFVINDENKITTEAKVIGNKVDGNQPGGRVQSLSLLKEKAGIGYVRELYSDNETKISNSVKFTEETSLVNNDKQPVITDTKLTLEDGVKFEGEISNNLTYNALVNAGVIADYGISDYGNQQVILNFGGKGNIGGELNYAIDDDTKLVLSGNGYVAGNKNYLNYGAEAELIFRKQFYNQYAVYPNSSMEFGLGYSMNMTDINVGGFNEKVQNDQKITARALFDLGEKFDFYGKYQYNIPKKENSVTVGLKFNVD